MLNRILILLFLSLVTLSCASKSSIEVRLPIPTKKVKNLKGEAVFPKLFIGNPYRLLIIGDNLLVADGYKGKFLTLIDLKNPTKTKRLLHRGRGPNEYLQPREFFFHEPSNAISLFDKLTKCVAMYKIKDNQIKISSKTLLSSVRLDDHRVSCVIPLGNQYVANGPFGDNQLGLFDKDGKFVSTFGIYPGDKEGIDIPRAYYLKTQNTLSVSPDQKHFAVAGLFNDQLTFYRATETTPQKTKEYFSVDSEMIVSSSNNGLDASSHNTDKTTYMYQSLFSTNQYLYALYWGLPTIIKSKSLRPKSCSIVVFDWDGNLIQAYHIPTVLKNSIAVDEKNNCLYGLSQNKTGEVQLMKYQL